MPQTERADKGGLVLTITTSAALADQVAEIYDEETAPLVVAVLSGAEAFDEFAGERRFDLLQEAYDLASRYWDAELAVAVDELNRVFFPAAEPAVAQ